MSSTSDIQAKWQALRNRGLDLGAKTSPQQSAGFGGQVQAYQHGRIYWHADVGVFEVHGGILAHYAESGGPGFAPDGGDRRYGFPIEDESRTKDDRFPVSRFQWGEIHWVRDAGAVGIWGDFFLEYQRLGKETGSLGCPLIEPSPFEEGEVAYFERGCMWKGPASGGKVLTCTLTMLHLGRPLLVDPSSGEQRTLAYFAKWANVDKQLLRQIQEAAPAVFSLAWNDRLLMERVVAPGQPAELLPLLIKDVSNLEQVNSNIVWPSVNFTIAAHGPADLRDGGLYNLSIRLPNSRRRTIMPHALYAKSNWNNFWLIHATDLHVSRRAEGMRNRLQQLGLSGAAEAFVNYNDGLRELISYANHLHNKGMLDVVILTGDLVDYIYDDGERQGSGGAGNFGLLEQILRGLAPSPDGVASPELRVPVFTVLGNHDCRLNPYGVVFNIGIPFSDDRLVDTSSNYNLTKEEVAGLQGGIRTLSLVSDRDELFRMIDTDGWNERHSLDYYLRHINDKRTYVAKLGRHRLVMLDTGPDTGLPRGASVSALLAYLEDYLDPQGTTIREDISQSMSGSPNSFGYDDVAFESLRAAERDAQTGGLVIVGQHAPPFHIVGSEKPHYFRETEHPRLTNFDELYAFLVRHTSSDVWLIPALKAVAPHILSEPPNIQDLARVRMKKEVLDIVCGKRRGQLDGRVWSAIKLAIERTWTGGRWPRGPSPFYHAGSVNDLLDNSVPRRYNESMLQLYLGMPEVGGSRPVDLVLCGHTHQWVESRVTYRATDKHLQFFTDYYSENPTRYYPTIHMGVAGPAHATVSLDAVIGEPPAQIRDHRVTPTLEYASVKVPPNPGTLNGSTNKSDWWKRHRPMVIETGPLGPIDTLQRGPTPRVPYRGFRVLGISDNVINEMHYVTFKELHERQFTMPWEKRLGREP